MHPLVKKIICYGTYPLVMGFSITIIFYIIYGKLLYWPSIFTLTTIAMLSIATLEKIQPYQKEWLNDHDNTFTDIIHAIFNITLILTTAEILRFITQIFPLKIIWPTSLPLWLQLILVGLIIDFGLWYMHSLSHKHKWLWKLHAIHHSPQRLYWLNSEKRHPLSALILAMPSLLVLVTLSAPTILIGSWMTIMAIHLAFQHANLDYRLGFFKYLLAVAEVHRWHHKRGYINKNFGEVFIFWDILFKTYYFENHKIDSNTVGLNKNLPNQYIKQLLWPFKK